MNGRDSILALALLGITVTASEPSNDALEQARAEAQAQAAAAAEARRHVAALREEVALEQERAARQRALAQSERERAERLAAQWPIAPVTDGEMP